MTKFDDDICARVLHDTTSQVSDRARCEKPRLEIPSATSEIGRQPDYLDHFFTSGSVSEAQRQAWGYGSFHNVS